jgi:DNA-binding response OmpR family regulator
LKNNQHLQDLCSVRLLLVKNHIRAGHLETAALEQAGFTVDLVCSTAMPLDAVDASNYRVVILDIGLRGGDGLSILHSLRARKIPSRL